MGECLSDETAQLGGFAIGPIANFNEFSEIKKIVKIRTKFVKCPSVGLPRVAGYPSGTGVINYPGNFLLPDGYPGSELKNLMRFTVSC